MAADTEPTPQEPTQQPAAEKQPCQHPHMSRSAHGESCPDCEYQHMWDF